MVSIYLGGNPLLSNAGIIYSVLLCLIYSVHNATQFAINAGFVIPKLFKSCAQTVARILEAGLATFYLQRVLSCTP